MVRVPVAPIFIDTLTARAFLATFGVESPVADEPPLEEEPLVADELSVIELAIELSVVEFMVAPLLPVELPLDTLIATIVGDASIACGLEPSCGEAKFDCT